MRRLQPLRATVAVVLIALGLAVSLCFAPDNAYQRWQLLHGTIFDETRWIYERCHFDPTPIDVAILGASRSKQGVNAARLETALKARGVDARVVNFSILSPGRGADLAILNEMLSTKHPKLIIIGVQESPDRNEHEAYRYLPPAPTVLAPAIWRRLGYFADVAYLPYRQLTLLFAALLPRQSGLSATFDESTYAGSSVDTTGGTIDEGAAIVNADLAAPTSLLYEGSRRFALKSIHRSSLPRPLVKLVNADDRDYLKTVLATARARGVKVAFLYIPYFNGPIKPEVPEIYAGLGPIWNASFISAHPDWWADFVHLSRGGAAHLTDWLIDPVAGELGSPPAPVAAGAGH